MNLTVIKALVVEYSRPKRCWAAALSVLCVGGFGLPATSAIEPVTQSTTEPAPEDTLKSCVFHVILEARKPWRLLNEETFELVQQLMEEGTKLQKIGTQESLQQAKSKFEQVIQITQTAGERRLQQRAWSEMGETAFALDDPQGATTAYKQILPLLYLDDDNYEEQKVDVLGKIGKAYRALGKNQQALEIYNKALVLIRRRDRWMGNCLREARTLNSIGEIYADKNELEKALIYFEQALKLRQLLPPHPLDFDPVDILNNHGKIYFAFGDTSKALAFFDWSFRIAGWLVQSVQISWDALGSEFTVSGYTLDGIQQEAQLGVKQLEATISILNQLYPNIESPEQKTIYIDKLKQCEGLKAELERQLEMIAQQRRRSNV
ncbi:MAG: tetratricopeptide repeat protein [Synechococcales cyanobacterium RU_4_20]|nr:tetratricopeptide repeat protein [Synechococcales cyanobacterium RU_4_20]NJR68416.1 tetratricopeptide repeat protein [Synechococcales cyanobacterium CRU_2_2]